VPDLTEARTGVPGASRARSDLQGVALEHARRGVHLQTLLRLGLLAFLVLTLVSVPPAHGLVACAGVVAGYALWTLGVAIITLRGGPTAVRLAWLAQFVDLAVLAVLTLLTGIATPQSWTSDVFAAGFLLVPVLAATQLRPGICTAVVVPTVLVYAAAGIATRVENEEPWASLLLRVLLLAAVGIGCIALSAIQRSRVRTIGGLVQVRTDLLGELTELEDRERRDLSESLHDGALQYVLAARQDLDDARDTGDPEAFDRLEQALLASSRLLRSTVSELHPAVLERSGMPAALREMARSAAARGGFTTDVQVHGWPDDLRTSADALLHRTARELLANVVAHARAHHVRVVLAQDAGRARLEVTDDGVGIPDGAVHRSLRQGHIGITSHAVRIEAAGGALRLEPGVPTGTTVTVDVPAAWLDEVARVDDQAVTPVP
jgi:two-component system NarL family sensor kinase